MENSLSLLSFSFWRLEVESSLDKCCEVITKVVIILATSLHLAFS